MSLDSFHEQRKALVGLLARSGVRDRAVLRAVGAVPRHRFVGEDQLDQAYANSPLPIGEGQTISQPLVVALTAQALELLGEEVVLDVGTGSGYQAAILGWLCREVHSIERRETLLTEARSRLRALGVDNVHCHRGDGTRGLPDHAPFDAILVSAASPSIPMPLVEQLAVGGRLVIPIGGPEGQVLRRVRKQGPGNSPIVEDLIDVRYVPLVGEHGWPAPKGEKE